MKAVVKTTKQTVSVSLPINNNGCYVTYKLSLKTNNESLENNFGMDSKGVKMILSICANFRKLHIDSELSFVHKMADLFNSCDSFAKGMQAIQTYRLN